MNFWSLPTLFSGRVMLVMEPTLLPLGNRLDQCSVIRFGNKKCWLPEMLAPHRGPENRQVRKNSFGIGLNSAREGKMKVPSLSFG